MTRPPRPRREHVVPAVVAALVASVVLGPALGRGVVLAYDLAWSPDPRLTPFTLGTSTPAPRAVPSDAAAVVLGWVLGAGWAQALVLWGTLVLAGVGAARLAALLAPDLGLVARSAAAVAAVWNPFVLERLVVGQWTVLLGYAAVPHLLVVAAAGPGGAGADLAAGGVAGGVRRRRRQHPRPRRARGRRRPGHPRAAVARAGARRGIRARCLCRVGAAGDDGRGHLGAGGRHGVRRPRRHPARGPRLARERRRVLEPCLAPARPVGGRRRRRRGGPGPRVRRVAAVRAARREHTGAIVVAACARARPGVAERARPLRPLERGGAPRAGRRGAA